MIKMAKTTIRLNYDEWYLLLETLEAFDEIEIVAVKNAIGKRVYPSESYYRSRTRIRDVVSDGSINFSEYLT